MKLNVVLIPSRRWNCLNANKIMKYAEFNFVRMHYIWCFCVRVFGFIKKPQYHDRLWTLNGSKKRASTQKSSSVVFFYELCIYDFNGILENWTNARTRAKPKKMATEIIVLPTWKCWKRSWNIKYMHRTHIKFYMTHECIRFSPVFVFICFWAWELFRFGRNIPILMLGLNEFSQNTAHNF